MWSFWNWPNAVNEYQTEFENRVGVKICIDCCCFEMKQYFRERKIQNLWLLFFFWMLFYLLTICFVNALCVWMTLKLFYLKKVKLFKKKSWWNKIIFFIRCFFFVYSYRFHLLRKKLCIWWIWILTECWMLSLVKNHLFQKSAMRVKTLQKLCFQIFFCIY